MCFDYDSYAEFYQGRICRSRRSRRCHATRRTIEPGELYYRDSGRLEGEWFNGQYSAVVYCQRYLIHLHELLEGCEWSESWIAFEEIREYLHDTQQEWIDASDAARLMEWFYTTQQERKKKAVVHG